MMRRLRSLLPGAKPRGGLFLWIPKCAGTSIASVCHDLDILVDPLNVADLSGTPYVSAEDHPSRFTFGFVRNPWDRVVSAYAMFRRGRRPQWLAPPSLAEFLDICASEPLEQRPRDVEVWMDPDLAGSLDRGEIEAQYRRSIRNHTAPVTDPFYKLFDEHGNRTVDFIGRFETLNDDFTAVCRRLRIDPPPLPHRNPSRREDYAGYYDAATRRKVEELFAAEIDEFGYSFEG